MRAIEINGLTKDYLHGFWRPRPRRALDHLSLTVEEGEIFALLGPNGAGKTTTLKLLMRLIYPTEGSARLLGQPFESVEVHQRIGYLPEAPYFYDYLSAREFLDYCGQLFGLERSQRRRRVGQLLEQVGLSESAEVALRHFSRGMLQRVGIAQALMNDPALLFLDEPMLGLDPVGRREVRDLIQELHQEGKTICLSTHILADVELLCGRVAVLNRGRLHGLGELREMLSLEAQASEVLVAGSSPALAEALLKLAEGLRTAGDRITLTVPDGTLDAVVDCIRQHKAQLLSITPVRSSLEDYFFDQFGTEKIPEGHDQL